MSKTAIIVGASHAASQVCFSLRQGGWKGEILVIGAESVLPYHRPPLSKDFLSGEKNLENILIRPKSTCDKSNIQIRLGTKITSLDRESKCISLSTGEKLPYDKLILTTGARVRKLQVPGSELNNVFYLRSSEDVLNIKSQITPHKRAVIIGGGYIGLETAASLKKQGMSVTILEAMPRILQRVTAPELSMFYKRVHKEEGVEIVEDIAATSISQNKDSLGVATDSGAEFSADFVIIGIGVIPNTELATEAGLDVENGVVVNEFCQTSDPDIYAAGDVTNHFNPTYKRHIRLESVPNATEQAKIIALHLNGKPKPYNSLPWFWSDQFDLKLQIAGLSEGYNDIIIRGDIENSRKFSVFYFKNDQFIAVDAMNSPREFMFSKTVLTKGQNLNKNSLKSPSIKIKDCLLA